MTLLETSTPRPTIVKKTKKRQKSKTGWPARHYVFGAWEPHENLDHVIDQLRKANRYRNALIEIVREQRQQADELAKDICPYVRDAEEAYTTADTAVQAYEKMLKLQNIRAGKRVATKAQRDELARLKQVKYAAERRRYDARRQAFGLASLRKKYAEDKIDPDTLTDRQWREAYGDPRLYTPLQKINAAAAKKSRAARKASGLAWGTYQAVEAAVTASCRTAAMPKFRSFTGTGCIAVHFQNNSIVPWREACRGEHNWLRIRTMSLQERKRVNSRGEPIPLADHGSNRTLFKPLVEVSMRLWDEGRGKNKKTIWVKFQARLHREPPAGSYIKWVFLRRKRCGTQRYWALDFVLIRPHWERERAETGIAGVDVGWRLRPQGMRVAYLADDHGNERELLIPNDHLEDWKRHAQLQSERDLAFNDIRKWFRQWTRQTTSEIPGWIRELLPVMHLWQTPRQLARMVRYWREHRFDGDDHAYKTLEEWRRGDRELYDISEAIEKRAIRRRNDMYRKFAAQLARTYHTVRVENTNWHELLQRPGPETPNSEARVRKYSRIGAVGTLRQYIAEAVANMELVEAAFTTLRCGACGEINHFDKARHLLFTCTNCGYRWDQDENAAGNILTDMPVNPDK